MGSVDVTSDVRRVQVALGRLRSEVVDAATVRALNKTATTVRAEASKEIRKTYNIKAAVAKNQIKITKARKGTLYVKIIASGKRLPLIEFGAVWDRKNPPPIGASVKVLTQGARKRVKGAFIAQAKGGKLGLFRRVGKARKPLEYLLSVGVAQAFVSKKVLPVLLKLSRERFVTTLQQEYNFAILRAGLKK